jgi:hypothetical protein
MPPGNVSVTTVASLDALAPAQAARKNKEKATIRGRGTLMV